MATKNKLSVYLVKEGITSANDIFEDPGKIRVLERYSENSAAYFVPSLAHEPNWLRNFFLRGGDGMLLQANSRVVLIKSIQIDEEYRTFALTFGYARFLFREDVLEEQFGLKIVLNSIKQNQIRRISKASVGSNQKQSDEQLPKSSDISEFGFDVNRDLMKNVSGKSEDDMFEKSMLTGGDIFSLTVARDISNIDEFLVFCYRRFKEDTYRERFAWVDNIKYVKEKTVIQRLNERLIATIRANEFDRVWMAVPEVVAWEDIKDFKFAGCDETFGDIFVDECSTIDNRTMGRFLSKMSPDTFLVLAGDIHQIESIEFGNWFFYAKDIIKTPGANVELLSTWRTQDQALISLWNEVRTRADMITEKLVINGPYSEDIGPNVFKRECEDEVILCLNYDGKFGLNNMNNYFQAANTKGEAIPWAEWSYKVGDPILFNDSKRFDLLYNNLKGRIVDIEKHSGSISFTVDVEIPLTELMCKRDGIEFIESIENGTRIRFAVYEYDESKKGEDLDENLRLKSVVPFQLAYAVSIHKAQGLEYDSVKVIIPSNNAEKITHGIFYTAITRAKTNLKIYWSSETMHDVVKGFATDESKRKSLEIVKTKLGKN